MEKAQWKMKSKIGSLYLVASDEALLGVFWKKQGCPLVRSLNGSKKRFKILSDTINQLEEYFEGKRTHFDLPLKMVGTSFQMSVWQELAKVPFGKTHSYQEMARRINRAKAYRAVGTANGKNPYSIILPCHRIIAADGTLGGYAGGLNIKRKLLDFEKLA
jgi:methylated-DNA-[protein]-cysteine S-methyltransferase